MSFSCSADFLHFSNVPFKKESLPGVQIFFFLTGNHDHDVTLFQIGMPDSFVAQLLVG